MFTKSEYFYTSSAGDFCEINKVTCHVALVGLTAWVPELKAKNQAVVELVGERYTDESGKPPLK
ncbi:DUF6261 family protein [Draconibacterium halophilum]|uniref:Uncharacterized protein n=1 Tax=Draconibacterium halophilum TaxID=2706887 RepID=A0A6C0RIH9_9BACT|nr:DUF6261 family protein [Draconibacterium halophilum]QIA09465.1 hypothetical protein G0Q07_17915 [Draconibacterium halophilum]